MARHVKVLHAPAVRHFRSGVLTFSVSALFMACPSSCATDRNPSAATVAKKAKPMKEEASTFPGSEPYSPAMLARLEAAFQDKGKDYVPRTHHKLADGSPKYTNRLIFETSPYLLQHAHNPVNWHAWGDEAFALATALNRPILLSVGYSTCHWCHVMERESFEDEEIAAFINANFIPIKVDREERPDVDSVYMTAVNLMTGRGGWPMTVVMTPDGKPFFGGTYFPARDGDRGSRVGFFTILQRLSQAYRSESDQVLESAARLLKAMQAGENRVVPQDVPPASALHGIASKLAQRFDPINGGFGGAPKFPRPSTYEFLLRYWRRSKDPAALHMVTFSLEKMMQGGIYDHVGGGFHRYATDAKWLVPHFEKMLYDNAQLIALFVETYQATGDHRFATTAKESLDYVLREMTNEQGAFFSATDADSEGEEGKFFVWSPKEIEEIVGRDDADVLGKVYNVTQRGNFEGHNILNRSEPLAVSAKRLGVGPEALTEQLRRARGKLYEARKKRIPPLLDDKVLTEWNAQMISAFARASLAFDDARYREAATRAGNFVWKNLVSKGRIKRAFRLGTAKHEGVLEDYAFLIAACIDLFEATSDVVWLARALELESSLEAHFFDPKLGGFYATADDGEQLLVREKPLYDGAQPSGNSVAAMNLLRLAELTTDAKHAQRAESVLELYGKNLAAGGSECPKLAQALEFYHDQPKEIVVVAGPDGGAEPLLDVVRATFLPNRVLVTTKHDAIEALQSKIPWVEGKRAMKDQATAYVCIAQSCKRPTGSPATLKRQLAQTKPLDVPALKLTRP